MRGSLLRYPGGKSKIYELIERISQEYNLGNRTYVEPFAGGFGLGIKSICSGLFNNFIINDYDLHIFAFWHCIFNETDFFIDKIKQSEITVDEWLKQKNIYNNASVYDIKDVGFSTFFLNRTNYSGILKGGPIGGFTQRGKYKIDCRFNKNELIKNIKDISNHKNQVEIYNLDASRFIDEIIIPRSDKLFVNFDPPYVKRGAELYANYYTEDDHIKFKRQIELLPETLPWIMTYDDCELIRELYYAYYPEKMSLRYSAGTAKEGEELFIRHLDIVLPTHFAHPKLK